MTGNDQDRKQQTATDSEARVRFTVAEAERIGVAIVDPEARRLALEAFERLNAEWYRQVHARNTSLDIAAPLAARETARLAHSAETKRDRGQRYRGWYRSLKAMLADQVLGPHKAAQEANDMLRPMYEIETGHSVDAGSFTDMLARWGQAAGGGK